MSLLGGSLLRIARLRAGLTQRELAGRLALPQSSVARWESGSRAPSIDNLVEAVRACGLDPVVSLFAMDRSNDAFIWELLDETPAERLRQQVAAANSVRPIAAEGAIRGASGVREPPAAEFNPLPLFRALVEAGVRFVLVGSLAESLSGSPILPRREVALCLDPGGAQLDHLVRAIAEMAPTRWHKDEDHANETPLALRQFPGAERWWLEPIGGALAHVRTPPGTDGFSDLVRHAKSLELETGLEVRVASLLDLIRMADASIEPADRAALPTLIRALELSEDYLPPDERPLVVPEGLEGLFSEHGLTSP